MRVHFGLGDAMNVYSVEINWPSGRVEKLQLRDVDCILTVEENKGVTSLLKCASRLP